ncbi:MAG: hypothetical protein JWN54_2662, partial [Mycobacterium sp.]|nr:hypothetical protein [Mycobacterium sp.]
MILVPTHRQGDRQMIILGLVLLLLGL